MGAGHGMGLGSLVERRSPSRPRPASRRVEARHPPHTVGPQHLQSERQRNQQGLEAAHWLLTSSGREGPARPNPDL